LFYVCKASSHCCDVFDDAIFANSLFASNITVAAAFTLLSVGVVALENLMSLLHQLILNPPQGLVIMQDIVYGVIRESAKKEGLSIHLRDRHHRGRHPSQGTKLEREEDPKWCGVKLV